MGRRSVYGKSNDTTTTLVANDFFEKLKHSNIDLPKSTNQMGEGSLYEMNIGFARFECVHAQKGNSNIVVIAPSGFGTDGVQKPIWRSMESVIKIMNESAEWPNIQIIFQTSYNAQDSGKYNSLFDKMLHDILKEIQNKHPESDYKAPEIESKACSERMISQYAIKLHAFL